jgi:hypothetical protein
MENNYKSDCDQIIESYFLLCIQNKNSTAKVKYNCMNIAQKKIDECLNQNKKIKSS